MTIRELFREFVVAKRRWEDDRIRDIHLAWQGVRIYAVAVNAKRVPEFHSLIGVPKQRQTLEDMEAQLRTLSKQTGFRLRERAA